MSEQTYTRPTDSELEILNLLWAQGTMTVRAVHTELAHTKEAGYTTTLKLMQIMLEKGLITRVAAGKAHCYSARITREETQGKLVQRIIDTVFNGSAAGLVLQALGHHTAGPEELQLIRKFLERHPKK